MSDSPELFELDSEEDDDIVTQRLRRAGKARRSARKADSAPPETAQVSERGTLAASDDGDSEFEIDPPDDDIFARRRRPSAKASAPAGTGRWFMVAIVVGVVAGVILGAALLSDDGTSAQTGTGNATSSVDLEEVMADIATLETQLVADPDNYEAHVDLGGLLCRIGDSDGAFEHLTTATELSPDRQEAWLLAGMCYASQDPADTAEAQRALTKVVELDPGSELGQNAQSLLDGLGDGSTEPADGE